MQFISAVPFALLYTGCMDSLYCICTVCAISLNLDGFSYQNQIMEIVVTSGTLRSFANFRNEQFYWAPRLWREIFIHSLMCLNFKSVNSECVFKLVAGTINHNTCMCRTLYMLLYIQAHALSQLDLCTTLFAFICFVYNTHAHISFDVSYVLEFSCFYFDVSMWICIMCMCVSVSFSLCMFMHIYVYEPAFWMYYVPLAFMVFRNQL